VLTLRHDLSQISTTSAQDFLDKVALVMEAISNQPDSLYEELPLIGETAQAILPDLGRAIPVETFPGVAECFFEVARRHAAEPAIVGEHHRYSYGDLARTVARLAEDLLAEGLQPEDVVAVHGKSSFGMLASMLAVLAAGGVLVTLDATLPADRQQLIGDISKARHHIHVVDAKAPKVSGAVSGLRTPAWPSADELRLVPDSTFEPPVRSADAAAYLFFTSGSTGTPKGVLGSHRGLEHFLSWQRSQFKVGPGDRAAQLTALSFDVVLRDILFPLTSGACIHIPPRELMLDARRMLRWIESSRITTMHCVPSLMKAWLQAHRHGQPLASLRFVFFAGEPLVDSLLKKFGEANGQVAQIVNLYGPTETTLAKLFNRLDRVEPGVQPVGQPQPGVDVVILRNRRTPCGLWETGEIAIRTPYRSHGYHRNPELTREVFVPNPWRDDPQDLIYFTGDLGRWRPDGKVEIFGRIDAQIKIRGVRIEPHEIESQMLRVPGVRDAAVAVRSSTEGDKQLVGFLVAQDSASEPASDLPKRVKAALRLHLQDAMVPARFVVLENMPHLPNGKIDRKSLAALAMGSVETAASASTGSRAALSPAAQKLVTDLERILGGPIESLDDSFIALGGDSLSYVRASLLVEDALGRLPSKWEEQPLSSLLQQLRTEAPLRNSQTWWAKLTKTASMETALLFRALAIMIVILSHLSLGWNIPSATPVLFAIAGLNFHRFLLPAMQATGQIWPSLRFVLKFAIPAALWQLMLGIKNQNLWWPDLFLMGTAFQQPGNPGWKLWFLDVLAANVLLMALAVVIIHSLHATAAATRKPLPTQGGSTQALWGWGWLAMGLAISVFHDATQWWNGPLAEANISPFKWLWMLGVGVLIATAGSVRHKWIVTATVGVLALLKYQGPALIQQTLALVDWFFFACLLALLWIERVDHRVDHRRRGADGAELAHALGRPAGWSAGHEVSKRGLEAAEAVGARQRVVHEAGLSSWPVSGS
jgi:amino acid adenylation domain-containing protein